MAWTAGSLVGTQLSDIKSQLGQLASPTATATGSATTGQRAKARNKVLDNTGFAHTTSPTTGAAPTASTPATAGNVPGFLQNPAGVLNNAMFPYEDLLARIFAPQQSVSALPPALAQAYAAQANANAARTNQQIAATQAAQAIPGAIADSMAREQALRSAPWSLSGLPTGLGYSDPLMVQQANTFNLRARALGAPALSPINSGWLSPGLY